MVDYISGCPTALSAPEVRLLQQYASGRRVVECGALFGYSTIKLAEVASHVVSIDKHEGYSGNNFRRYMSNLERVGLRHKVTPVVGDALQLLPIFREQEFYFIDLTGTWWDTHLAIKSCMSSPAVIGIHDFGRSGCSGVEAAVLGSHCRIIEKADTLVIIVRW